DKNRKNARAAS
ncbi:hypothetical protein EC900091_3241, partial [Escherichia coli 90.0091]